MSASNQSLPPSASSLLLLPLPPLSSLLTLLPLSSLLLPLPPASSCSSHLVACRHSGQQGGRRRRAAQQDDWGSAAGLHTGCPPPPRSEESAGEVEEEVKETLRFPSLTRLLAFSQSSRQLLASCCSLPRTGAAEVEEPLGSPPPPLPLHLSASSPDTSFLLGEFFCKFDGLAF